MSLYLAEMSAKAAQAAAKEAEEDIKLGLASNGLERLFQAKDEIMDAIYRVREHQKAHKAQEKRDRLARTERINAAAEKQNNSVVRIPPAPEN